MSSQQQQNNSQDTEEYGSKSRMKSIHEARKRVPEKESDVKGWQVQGLIGKQTADTIFRQAVENYIIELEFLVKRAQEEDIIDTDYWGGVPLGTQQLPSGDVLEFEGLQSILDAPEIIEDQWREEVRDEMNGSSFRVESRQVQIDRRIIKNAYRQCNQFVGEIGLDLDISAAQEYEMDYVDLYEDTVGIDEGGDDDAE